MESYDRHANQEKELSTTDDLPACFQQPRSIDAWRHRRMIETIFPLLHHFPGATWMTIGDGKFGSDAYFLQSQGVDVLATSISTHTLEVAHSRGYIKKYAAENAEMLSLKDNSIDFVLCKESYHHFPMPPKAFYEMLRVARKAIVLIEPIEGPARLLSMGKSFAKRVLRGDVTEQFEVSGNYLYRLNVREIFKMLCGPGYGGLAWKGINDFYLPRFKFADAEKPSFARFGTHAGIGVQDFLSSVNLLNYGLAAVVCFKKEAPADLLEELKRKRFQVMDRLVNPYA